MIWIFRGPSVRCCTDWALPVDLDADAESDALVSRATLRGVSNPSSKGLGSADADWRAVKALEVLGRESRLESVIILYKRAASTAADSERPSHSRQYRRFGRQDLCGGRGQMKDLHPIITTQPLTPPQQSHDMFIRKLPGTWACVGNASTNLRVSSKLKIHSHNLYEWC